MRDVLSVFLTITGQGVYKDCGSFVLLSTGKSTQNSKILCVKQDFQTYSLFFNINDGHGEELTDYLQRHKKAAQEEFLEPEKGSTTVNNIKKDKQPPSPRIHSTSSIQAPSIQKCG